MAGGSHASFGSEAQSPGRPSLSRIILALCDRGMVRCGRVDQVGVVVLDTHCSSLPISIPHSDWIWREIKERGQLEVINMQ